MIKTYTDGCACRAVRYETQATPIFQNHCQCRDCQFRSGAGHGSYLTFADRAEVTVTGELSSWRLEGDSGGEKIQSFCPTCGTPVQLTRADMPDLMVIAAGSLDDPGQSEPQAIAYASRGQEWNRMDSALQAFARMPG